MKRIVLIPLLLSTFLLVGCERYESSDECIFEKSKSCSTDICAEAAYGYCVDDEKSWVKKERREARADYCASLKREYEGICAITGNIEAGITCYYTPERYEESDCEEIIGEKLIED